MSFANKYDFYHFIGGEGRTADLLRQYAEKFYMMGEASMRRSIRKGSKWDGYKRNLLQEARRREADRLEVVVDGPTFARALLRPVAVRPGRIGSAMVMPPPQR